MRAYRVAYDGRPYAGFQRQPDVPTVEDTLFAALDDLGITDGGKPPGYAAAGRTDAGVSALAQTVAFEAPDWCSPAALNGELPASVRAWASASADPAFHATHDAVSRAYTYHLHAPGADLALARDAAASLVGEHDFRNLTTDRGDTVRTVLDVTVERDDAFLVFSVRAEGFLRHLVRRMVSLVEAVATGARDPEAVDRLLDGPPVDGPDGVAPAPPYPLVLTDAEYPGLAFERDDRAAASARDVFGERRAEHAARARVAGTIHSGL